MKRAVLFTLMVSWILLLNGCARIAVKMSPPLLRGMTDSVFEECDPQLAREAVPADLKVMEGLLKTDPENRAILSSLSMGFAGYALLFVEEDNPVRASSLYLRSRDYALKALSKGRKITDAREDRLSIEQTLLRIGPEDLQALFWTAFSWNAWINLNLDNPAAFAQLETSQACLDRVLAIDSAYFHGLPEILEGVMQASRPALLGGDREKARSFFEKALERSGRSFFPAQYYYAKYYAVGAQDRALFRNLLQEIITGDPNQLREVCLINTVFRQKAERLASQEDELFY